MRSSFIGAAVALGVAFAACSNDSEPSEPASLAFVDSSTTAADSASVAPTPTAVAELPEGLEIQDLPASLSERLSAMNQWLRGHEPALNSGNSPYIADADGNFTVEQFINTVDRGEAERLCRLYVDAAEAFSSSAGRPVEVVLSGWALGDDDRFFEPGWTPISCDLEG